MTKCVATNLNIAFRNSLQAIGAGSGSGAGQWDHTRLGRVEPRITLVGVCGVRLVGRGAGGLVYLAMTSPIMCAATLGVCVTLWTITLLYGEYARRTQKVFQDTLASANQARAAAPLVPVSLHAGQGEREPGAEGRGARLSPRRSPQVAEEVLSLSRVVRTFGTEQVEESRYQGWLRCAPFRSLQQGHGGSGQRAAVAQRQRAAGSSGTAPPSAGSSI